MNAVCASWIVRSIDRKMGLICFKSKSSTFFNDNNVDNNLDTLVLASFDEELHECL